MSSSHLFNETDISGKPPEGCFVLAPKTARRVGDMFWSSTLRKWCETTIGEGLIPEHGTWCRRLSAAKPVQVAPRAPNAKSAPADWTRNCTPLTYVISDPFNEDDQLLVYQLDELKAALEYMLKAGHEWCCLYVIFLDHKTGDHDRHTLCWIDRDHRLVDPMGLAPKT